MATAIDFVAARHQWGDLVAVDEGLDRLFRWSPTDDTMRWSTVLAHKCRTLQRIAADRVLGVHDRGYFEAELARGDILRHVQPEAGGVVAASRGPDGRTFLSGIDLAGQKGVSFVEYNADDVRARRCCFQGDYVRGATLTTTDTILYTNNDRVIEGTWSGRVLREFAAPGFLHAWKALRLPNGHTLISAGYGAFVAEFDSAAHLIRRWQCGAGQSFARPHFFGDFTLLPDGSLIVCNWLGHGPGWGGTGCALLEFAPDGELQRFWQDAVRTSSVQAFALL